MKNPIPYEDDEDEIIEEEHPWNDGVECDDDKY